MTSWHGVQSGFLVGDVSSLVLRAPALRGGARADHRGHVKPYLLGLGNAMSRTSVTEQTIAVRVESLASTLDRCLNEGAKVFTGPSIHFHHRTIQRFAD